MDIKGIEVTPEDFVAILNDRNWQDILVFKDRDVYIDLEKYSEGGVYFPIGGDYCKGFFFIGKLYKCVYRTQDDLVALIEKIPEQPKPKKLVEVKRRIPTFIDTVSIGTEAACDTDDHKYIEVTDLKLED